MARRIRLELTIEVPKTSVFPITLSPYFLDVGQGCSMGEYYSPLLHPPYPPRLLNISFISSTVCIECKFYFSSTWSTSNSVSIWIFASWSNIWDSFTRSHEPCILISLWINIGSFLSFHTMYLRTRKSFLLCLLLFLFQDSHLIRSCHNQ